MKRLIYTLIILATVLPAPSQTRRNVTKKQQTATSATRKKTTRKTATKTTARKKAPAKSTAAKSKTANYSNNSIKGLQNKRNQIRANIKKQEQALRANKANVKKRLQDLLVINSEIHKTRKNIESIEGDIGRLDNDMKILSAQLSTLEGQLAERKTKYIKSMRYITRQHTLQDRLMFIFSAESFTQMYRRLRFVREYAAYQRAQGEAVKAKREQVNEKQKQLQNAKADKHRLLDKGNRERASLEGQQTEQQNVVKNLQKQQKTIQQVITQQRKEDAALNAQIDRLIAEEVAKAKARAEAEARRKAEAEAAKKREAELARKKAEAEALARENARRIAEAKEREARLKAKARRAAEQDNAAKRERAEQEAREAEADRMAAERKAENDERRHREDIARAKKSAEESVTMSSVDRKLSGNFESNKGRLPMPVTGNYRIVSRFGQNNVEGLKGVTLDNKGINILGSPGCQARSIFDGEVSAVFGFSGTMVVMVRHGVYISVYCNLSSVNVHRGQRVSARQTLGTVARDNILQFQLRRNMTKLNPETWLGR